MRPVVYIPPEDYLYEGVALPRDYFELTQEGQRIARINASRQWLIRTPDPRKRADLAVASLKFFDLYYLQPDEDDGFDPGFYDGVLPTPQFHWLFTRLWAMSRMSVGIAPRGSAKSTHSKRDTTHRLVTCPRYFMVNATSSSDNAENSAQDIKDQVYGIENRRITDDWSKEAEFGGSLKPPRGEKKTGVEHFYLNNGSHLRSVSAGSRLRGLRPNRFRLDDPEYDASASTSMEQLNDYTERLIFKIAVPMVLKAGSGIEWIGTMVSPRHYISQATHVVDTENGPVAEDERFNQWSRLLVPVGQVNPDTGRWESCWPEMWPADDKQREELGYRPDEVVTIEEMPSIIGQAAFETEMLGVRTSADGFFGLDTDPKGRHSWWIEKPDDALYADPWSSSAEVCYVHNEDTIKVPLGTFLRNSRTFICVDSSYTAKASSDRKACTLMAITRDNILFVLDLWSDRCEDATLETRAFSMANHWGCRVIHIEVVKETFRTFKRFEEHMRNTITEVGSSVAVKPIKPGIMGKNEKISTLDLRFEQDLIKLPLFKKGRSGEPWWGRLFDQAASFNPTAENGGLMKDDELDTVAMGHLFVAKRARTLLQKESDRPKKNPLEGTSLKELIARKESTVDELPIASGLDPRLLTPELMSQLLELHTRSGPDQEDPDEWTTAV